MQQEQEKETVADTFIEDYEEYLEEEDRWKPGKGGGAGIHKDRRHAVRRPVQGKQR